jgi:tRNA modification GTPase
VNLRARELTPRGPGAVAVVALEGPGAAALAGRLAGVALPPGVPRRARIVIAGEAADDALVCAGADDAAELHLHGSPALVRHVLRHLADAHGVLVDAAPPARTLEEAALAALPAAPCRAAARILLDQARGALRSALAGLAALQPPELTRALDALEERARVAGHALRPTRVVLAGPVNAGKSTLFNALVGRERAITDAEPGTTRDVLTERVLLGDWPVELGDAAGARELAGVEADAELERAGQALAADLRARADLVLWLVPPGQAALPPADERTERVWTQSDRAAPGGAPALSARSDPEGARRVVEALFRRHFALPEVAWTPGAAVPFDVELRRALAALRGAVTGGGGADVAAALGPWLAGEGGRRCTSPAPRLR